MTGGVAVNIEEYVPTASPRATSVRVSPPRTARVMRMDAAPMPVLTVRGRVGQKHLVGDAGEGHLAVVAAEFPGPAEDDDGR